MIKIKKYEIFEDYVNVEIETEQGITTAEIPPIEFQFIQYINSKVESGEITEDIANTLFEFTGNLNDFYFNMGQVSYRMALEKELKNTNMSEGGIILK
jgi:hypothetical protein